MIHRFDRMRHVPKSALLCMAVHLALAGVTPVFGQSSSADGAPEGVINEVVVTSSRVVADGFSAPTPTSTLTAADLEKTAPLNVTEALAQIPTFRTSLQPSSSALYANLRNIGAQRTLVLVDGRRHVPTFSDGTVDLNLIPSALIARTEVVTGGASASWGSDAVAGVVNLILKEDLEGLSGTAQSGISGEGDAENYGASVAFGSGFAGNRGHVLIGAEYAQHDGVRTLQPPYYSRDWVGRNSLGNSAFATNGLPGVIYADDVRRADVADGGLITSGPLRGTEFLPGGATGQFGYGQVFGNNMLGGTSNFGDTPIPGGDLMYPYKRYTVMSRVGFDVTDSVRLFAEGSYGRNIAEGLTNPARNNGSITPVNSCAQTTLASALGSINVNIDNAYLPASVRSQMQAAGVNCFSLGRTFRDPGMGQFGTHDGSPQVYRGVLGAEGDLAGSWRWDTYVQYGSNRFEQNRIGNLHIPNFRRAIDAVAAGPGAIACRVNIDANATNDDPSCVPFNLFGSGSPSAGAIDYVTGTSWMHMDTEQTVAAVNFRGDLFSTWAGTVAGATGIEYRKEEIDATVDADSEANNWQTANRKSIRGDYDAKEVYAEVVVPLLDSKPFADSVDTSLAARYTDYSSSGGVTTWKAGLSWELSDQVRLRATKSRDIRAGNLGELYTPTAVAIQNVRNPITAASLPAPITTTGNPELAPEEADTFTAGFVYTPAWLDGLNASVDYYSIDVDGQIGTLTAQQILDRCYLDGLPVYCARVTTNATGVITGVVRQFENLDKFATDGVDVELSYRRPFASTLLRADGSLLFRLLGSYVNEFATTATSTATTINDAGEYNTPRWTLFGTAGYEGERWSTTLEGRWYSGGQVDNTLVEGAIAANGVNRNHVASTLYTNATIQYAIAPEADWKAHVYFRVNNIFNEEPPFAETGTATSALFDVVGRNYRLGIRFDL
jgi:iron complex outermembrane receptor protein